MKFLSLDTMLQNPYIFLNSDNEYKNYNLETVENSPEDILNGTIEMLEKTSEKPKVETSNLQDKFRDLAEKIYNLTKEQFYSHGNISPAFLEKIINIFFSYECKIFDLKVKNNNTKKLLNSSFNKLLSHGQFFLGPEVSKFEKKVAKFLGVKYSVAVGSGSSALYLALKSCGIGKGDEVITTPLTWIITVHAIAACGAKPVFIDVRDDFNINPNLIQKKKK